MRKLLYPPIFDICHCGICNEIVWGGRRYVNGHNCFDKILSEEHKKKLRESRKNLEIDRFIEEHTGRHFCKHCGKVIIIRRWHYNTGIPEYSPNHGKIDRIFSKIDKWIEENQGRYFCGCSDHEVIVIKPHHYYYGIPEYICGHQNKGKELSGEHKQKISGENSCHWKGGTSFEPYCPKFNEKKREEIRNKYDRKCYLCGKDEKNNITKTNKLRKLSVHHTDFDKEQGCNGKTWKLVPLCMSCHSKLRSK